MATTTIERSHRVLVADELGILRCIDKPQSSGWDSLPVTAIDGNMDKTQGVECMSVSSSCWKDSSRGWIAVGRTSGDVCIHAAGSKVLQQIIKLDAAASIKDSAVSTVAWLDSYAGAHPALLVIYRNGGTCIYRCDSDQGGPAHWVLKSSYSAPAAVICCGVSADEKSLAIGCDGCELRILDTETGARQAAFKKIRIGLVS